MTIDHVGLVVPETKFQETVNVYLEALKPLGYSKTHQFGDYLVGLGSSQGSPDGKPVPDFWLTGAKDANETKSHALTLSTDRATVDAVHAAALKAGAKDNGAPGVRAMYHPNYYGAFFIDPAGNNAEAVCHAPA
ncbi:glyoxalase family protein [Purpureocillium lavendulum]|uniref:Glyoxalase family protein n=1 Tax=Purpureocillium lavendulum TaxID=1247861 RepID=A0AB34FVQ2_9HYPO|nr:glyoxalase family protein [Purpureocillium lavendulum]